MKPLPPGYPLIVHLLIKAIKRVTTAFFKLVKITRRRIGYNFMSMIVLYIRIHVLSLQVFILLCALTFYTVFFRGIIQAAQLAKGP